MTRVTGVLIAVAICWAAPVAVANAVTTAPSTETLVLDSYYNWNRHHTPPVSSDFKIKRGQYYVASVSGTFSYYSALNYSVPQKPWTIVCGNPLPAPEYQGSLGGEGPVGFDAQFIFARPWTANKCTKANLPVQWVNFQMKDGSGWSHPKLIGGPRTAPTSDHTYDYAVRGRGKAVAFRLFDLLTRDNYGLLKISLAPATASDCSSYAAFGFASETACTSALGGT